MNQFLPPARKLGKYKYFIALSVLWIIYAALSVSAPGAGAVTRYGITTTQGNMIRATVLLPSLFIWLTALYAVLRFRRYAKLIGDSPEAAGFKRVSDGLVMLLSALVVPGLVSIAAQYYPDSFVMQKTISITRNYLTIAFYLAAFWSLLEASRNWQQSIGDGNKENKGMRTAVLMAVGVLAVVYVWAVFHNSIRTVSNDPLIKPTYYLPDWLIVLTVIFPYMVIWIWGSLTVVNIRGLIQQVRGSVYRKAFSFITYGLITIVGLLIGLQFLTQAGTVLGRASLGFVLLVIYALLIIIAVGYLFLAKGAKQLSAIEEIE